MRDYDEAYAAARDRPAFSNGTEGECWMENWCARCVNDSPELVNQGKGCPLILVALMGRTPSEWLEQDSTNGYSLSDGYHCIEFRDRDDPGSGREPVPTPDPPGQLTLLPAEPYRGIRMYAPVAIDWSSIDNDPLEALRW